MSESELTESRPVAAETVTAVFATVPPARRRGRWFHSRMEAVTAVVGGLSIVVIIASLVVLA